MAAIDFGAVMFYATETPVMELVALSTGPAMPPVDEVIELPAAGGQEDRELAVPFLAGMDEVIVSTASMHLQGVPVAREPEGWAATERPGEGYLVQLAQPARLRAIVVDTPTIDPTITNAHAVVRPAQPKGGAWDIGPPMFASPSFWVGDLYPNALAGLDQWTEAGGRTRFTFPSTQGSGWLLHWATGDEPTKLAFLAVTTTVRSVTVEPAASDLRLALRADDAGDEVLLWQFPAAFTPDAGEQAIDFTPIAAKRLNARLALANKEPTPPPTLSLPLRLSATAGGPIGVSGAALSATYCVSALDGQEPNAEPATLKLRGDWESITLRAPAALRPQAGTLVLTAHHLGRERNGPLTPPAPPGGPGRTVSSDRWEATSLRIAPSGPGAAAAKADVGIVSVAIDVGADAAAELVVELRADLHGGPGRVLASAVAQLAAGARAWTELELGAAVPPAKPGWRLWLALRTNHGAVRWYGEDRDGAAVRTSIDRGETWAGTDDALAGSSALRARLFHAVATTPNALSLSIYAATQMLPELTLSRARDQTTEFTLADGVMPDSLLDLLGRAGPTATGTKVDTVVRVTSAAALDMTVRAVDLTYSPTARPTDA